MSLQQSRATDEWLRFEYEDIETVDDVMGFYVVRCFMGCHPGRNGVVAIAF